MYWKVGGWHGWNSLEGTAMDQGQEASPTTLLESVSVNRDPDPKPVTVSVVTSGKLKASRWIIRPQT